jgi:hypothetical protein
MAELPDEVLQIVKDVVKKFDPTLLIGGILIHIPFSKLFSMCQKKSDILQ